jgi:hypothetical protein
VSSSSSSGTTPHQPSGARFFFLIFFPPFPPFLFFSFDRLASLLFLPITAIPGFGGLTFSEIPDNLGMCACAQRVVSCRVA